MIEVAKAGHDTWIYMLMEKNDHQHIDLGLLIVENLEIHIH